MTPAVKKNLSRLFVVLAIISLAVTLILVLVQQKYGILPQTSTGLILIFLCLYAITAPGEVTRMLNSRQLKYSSNAAVYLLAVFGILLICNFLANKYNIKWDLTSDGTNTLSKETVGILNSLPSDVNVYGFFSPNIPSDKASSLLDSMKLSANGKLNYQFIDPISNPVIATQYGVDTDGTIIFEMDDRQQTVRLVSEEEFAGALLKLSSPNLSVVYFLSGHGERELDGAAENSLSSLQLALQKKNYTINSLDLLQTPNIPEDASLIVIAGPQKPLTQTEVDTIAKFMDAGKSLVLLADPEAITQFEGTTDPLAVYLRNTWGILLANDVIFDLDSATPSQSVASEYSKHPIVKRLANLVTVFPSARSVVAADPGPTDILLDQLIKTSSNSWAETDIEGLKQNQLKYDEGKDLPGPVPLAVAASNSGNKARMVVIGNSYFATDQNFSLYGNADFLVNSIDWVTENSNLIQITPKSQTERILIPPTRALMNMIFVGVVIMIPGIILLIGLTTWLQRKRSG